MKTYAFRVPCELNPARVTATSKKAAAELYAAVNKTTFAEAQSFYAGIANEDAQGVVSLQMPVTHGIFERHMKGRVITIYKQFRAYAEAYPNAIAVFGADGQLSTVR